MPVQPGSTVLLEQAVISIQNHPIAKGSKALRDTVADELRRWNGELAQGQKKVLIYRIMIIHVQSCARLERKQEINLQQFDISLQFSKYGTEKKPNAACESEDKQILTAQCCILKKRGERG